MESKYYKNYFVVVKLLVCLCTMIFSIIKNPQPFWSLGLEWFLVAVYIFSTIAYELKCRRQVIWLVLQGILLVLLISGVHLRFEVLIFLVLTVMDTLTRVSKNFWLCLAIYVVLLITPGNWEELFLMCTLLLILYYQNHVVVYNYEKYISNTVDEEYKLKENMETQKETFKKQLEQKTVYSENRILQDRERIFQQLHDRLGHSINGSIYQLEAAKVLITQKPEQSSDILQMVIDNLRKSMDEIRAIFRKEKPSVTQMAMVELVELCEECKERYGIDAQFQLEGEKDRIPKRVMEVILDNTCEAVTNALKYSKCTAISITIVVLNQRVRCTIKDNGKGCSQIVEGMGIQGMKNRMRMLNGVLTIQGEVGFEITMLFPIS